MALLGVAAASGLTMLTLILVKATNVLLPADTKVCLGDLMKMLVWVTRMLTSTPFWSHVVPSLGSCLTPAPPTHPCLCTSGQQTRRRTQEWSARP